MLFVAEGIPMDDTAFEPFPGAPLYFGREGDPVVVVVHDLYGRHPAVEAYSATLAARGFRVVVPDLYSGDATTDAEAAENMAEQLDIGLALYQLEELVEEARATGSTRAAVVGFSIGGWLALLHAQAGSADAVVAYYASLAADDHGVIPCPVQLHYAEVDEWSNWDHPDAFVGRLGDHGTPVERHVYPGTRHAFGNASIDSTLNLRAAALAFARTAAFLEKHLLE
jgi:carboxymethylenebutenolidase